MERPILKLEKRPFDWVLKILILCVIGFLLIYPFIYFSELPETIPVHFNFQGEPDGWGSKNGIWTLPAMGIFSYLLLAFFRSIPHVLNIPLQITPENAERQYRLVTRMLSWLSLLILLISSVLVYKQIQAGFENSMRLGFFFPVLLGGGLIGILGGFIFLSFKNK
ncbi:DUF1648 domain-containing protein [Algoriphagus mannitolivorans]|uniref:DUF1648 domain-containing protein n=1 Tax=Algoriphagus mannitolivorans TaxID=226504 RepID=UPI0012F79892|nr:DUF1648 domain-containing protein [Algoriphagus mannitolivorans]